MYNRDYIQYLEKAVIFSCDPWNSSSGAFAVVILIRKNLYLSLLEIFLTIF